MRQLKVTTKQNEIITELIESDGEKKIVELVEALKWGDETTEKMVGALVKKEVCELNKETGAVTLVNSLKWLVDSLSDECKKNEYPVQKFKVKLRDPRDVMNGKSKEEPITARGVRGYYNFHKDIINKLFNASKKELPNGMEREVVCHITEDKKMLLEIKVSGKNGLVSKAMMQAKEYKPSLKQGYLYKIDNPIHKDGEIMSAATIKQFTEIDGADEVEQKEFTGSCYYSIANEEMLGWRKK